jgi:hypothetical protein
VGGRGPTRFPSSSRKAQPHACPVACCT